MRSRNHRVVLDACVLVNSGVCDLLLRLAEPPSLYLPTWSKKILEETTRAKQKHRGWNTAQTERWLREVVRHFPNSEIFNYEPLIEACENDAEDRHVLACAIRADCDTIVTFNLRDFRQPHLEKWGIRAIHPQAYLLTLYELEPALVMRRLYEIVRHQDGKEIEDLLIHLGKSVPQFAHQVLMDSDS